MFCKGLRDYRYCYENRDFLRDWPCNQNDATKVFLIGNVLLITVQKIVVLLAQLHVILAKIL